MTLHIPGSPGEKSLNAMNDVLRAAFVAAQQQQFDDDQAKVQMYLQLAFEWLYYLKPNEVITVAALVRDYGTLREAPPHDVANLQARLKQYKL